MMETKLYPAMVNEEFEQIFKEQFSCIYNYIFYHIRNTTDAEDLTADVFVRAYKYWNSYSSDKASRGAWLGGIARNTVKSYLKRNAVSPKIIELSEVLSADADIEKEYLLKEELTRVFTQMDTLPELQRDLLTMKYLLRFTNRDIAKLMDMSECNVGVTLYRAIRKIQKNLQIV
jgi:RNA polymerase sigma-70 factor (ECF subfamily)